MLREQERTEKAKKTAVASASHARQQACEKPGNLKDKEARPRWESFTECSVSTTVLADSLGRHQKLKKINP